MIWLAGWSLAWLRLLFIGCRATRRQWRLLLIQKSSLTNRPFYAASRCYSRLIYSLRWWTFGTNWGLWQNVCGITRLWIWRSGRSLSSCSWGDVRWLDLNFVVADMASRFEALRRVLRVKCRIGRNYLGAFGLTKLFIFLALGFRIFWKWGGSIICIHVVIARHSRCLQANFITNFSTVNSANCKW